MISYQYRKNPCGDKTHDRRIYVLYTHSTNHWSLGATGSIWDVCFTIVTRFWWTTHRLFCIYINRHSTIRLYIYIYIYVCVCVEFYVSVVIAFYQTGCYSSKTRVSGANHSNIILSNHFIIILPWTSFYITTHGTKHLSFHLLCTSQQIIHDNE